LSVDAFHVTRISLFGLIVAANPVGTLGACVSPVGVGEGLEDGDGLGDTEGDGLGEVPFSSAMILV
jgi:hypothetical protein